MTQTIPNEAIEAAASCIRYAVPATAATAAQVATLALTAALPHLSASDDGVAVKAGYVAVPEEALKWLFGEGPNDRGTWFGDADDVATQKGRYWWRSEFRRQIALTPGTISAPGAAGGAIGRASGHDGDVVITLDADAYASFVAALDAPAAPNEKLKELFRKHSTIAQTPQATVAPASSDEAAKGGAEPVAWRWRVRADDAQWRLTEDEGWTQHVKTNGGVVEPLYLATPAPSEATSGDVASPEDTAEQFIQAAIDSAPEPLRRLGEWLANKLDEDDFNTAEPMLLGAAAALASLDQPEARKTGSADGALRVKPLEWTMHTPEGTRWTGHGHTVPINGYSVSFDGGKWIARLNNLVIGSFEARDEAFRACEAHHENRILAALSHSAASTHSPTSGDRKTDGGEVERIARAIADGFSSGNEKLEEASALMRDRYKDAAVAVVEILSPAALKSLAGSAGGPGEFERGVRAAAEVAADHTPAKHDGTLGAHVTGRAIETAIRALLSADNREGE